jgi:hypothetical protein
MMPTVNAILLKPIDGLREGDEREFDKVDFDRLEQLGAVRAVPVKAAVPPLNKMAPAPLNKSSRG